MASDVVPPHGAPGPVVPGGGTGVDLGPPPGFVALFVLVLIGGIALTVYRVSLASP